MATKVKGVPEHRRIRMITRGILTLCALFAAPLAGHAAQYPLADQPFVQITFLDVGQADAVVVRAPEGQTALIDAGRADPLVLLAQLGIEQIDLLVATHPHADHIGGMTRVLNALPVLFYMDNGKTHTTATYQRLLIALQRRPEITYLAAEPRTIGLGSVALEVLPLPQADAVDHNNRSVGLIVTFGEFRVFLSGDSEVDELRHFLAEGVVPDVTVLKAPHHGSDNGYTREFLEAARPEVVVISVGGNSYGHPGLGAMAAYESAADAVYRTDYDGHVTIRGYRDGRYEVLSGDHDDGDTATLYDSEGTATARYVYE